MLKGTAGDGQSDPSSLTGCNDGGPEYSESVLTQEGNYMEEGSRRQVVRPASTLHTFHNGFTHALGVGLVAGCLHDGSNDGIGYLDLTTANPVRHIRIGG